MSASAHYEDETVRDMINTKNMLLDNTNLSIESILRKISLSLNIQHYNGNIIYDYIPPPNSIDDDQLEQLSNLPTHKWDKELEQEFGPEVLQGNRKYNR